MTLILLGFGIGCVVGGVFVMTLVRLSTGRQYTRELESKFSITR